VAAAGAGRLLDRPFQQTALHAAVRQALEKPEPRRRWSEAGLAFGRSADIYHMPERAAALIEERIGAPIVPA
jgi:UDP-glucose:(heptosyl)LPS alpha-1,3-glucosyltransferase